MAAMQTLDELAPLTEKQEQARELLTGEGTHFLLSGGSRSGKTTLLVRMVILRCIISPNSTHAIFREHFNHIKTSIINDTLPKVLALWFPYLKTNLNKSDWFLEIFIGNAVSKIYFGGLDDKKRTEKILGQEHSTIYLNECSMISYSARDFALTRLAQTSGLKLKMFYDCNPPNQSHWLYKLFIKKVDPLTMEPLRRPDIYKYFEMNPLDNLENLPPEYIDLLKDMTKEKRDRFLLGKFGSTVPNALWPENSIKIIQRPAIDDHQGWAFIRSRLRRIVVGVDPSGCDKNEEVSNDQIGIGAVGLMDDGTALVLDDVTGYYDAGTWGDISCDLYHKWGADCLLGEANFGGDMVRETIHNSDTNVNFKPITVTRGKHLRAEPQAGQYEKGKVFHLGHFVDLEDEMSLFSTAGYHGSKSPNRVDWLVMCLKELFDVQKYDIGPW